MTIMNISTQMKTLIVTLLLLVSCGKEGNKAILDCSAVEKISYFWNNEFQRNENKKSSFSFVFSKELLEAGIQINDFTKTPPVLTNTDEKKRLIWIVEFNGTKFRPSSISTLNTDGSESYDNIGVFVDQNKMGFSRIHNVSKKNGASPDEEDLVSVSIDRISGELTGGQTLISAANKITNDISGSCKKADRKF